MAYRVGSKGQVVIEKRIRDELGIEPGSLAVQERVGDKVEIRFFPPEHRRSLRGALAKHVRRWPSPDQSWSDIVEEAWRIETEKRAEEGKGL
jgi:AbrB family looped-hinge helix DNA binding protein